MSEKRSTRIKIITTFLLLFALVMVMLLIVFYAGKKSYTVQFDLNGGILISGSLEQTVTMGQNAVPPTATKDGAYLHGWSESYKQITRDMVIQAVWEYETTPGIVYCVDENQNFAEIESAYPHINGRVYLGAYYNGKKVLGIRQSAFENCVGITNVYLLDGLLSIGKTAFSGCTGLTEIAIPQTVTHIGSGAFHGCESLETVVLSEGLWEIGSGAFSGCIALRQITLPSTITMVEAGAFDGCENLTIRVHRLSVDHSADWEEGWQGSATVRDSIIIGPITRPSIIRPILPEDGVLEKGEEIESSKDAEEGSTSNDEEDGRLPVAGGGIAELPDDLEIEKDLLLGKIELNRGDERKIESVIKK